MHSIPPHIARIFDDPHANARNGRRANRSRVESKGAVRKTPLAADCDPATVDFDLRLLAWD